MDPLTDFLPAMRVSQAVYTRVEATAPWGLDFIPYYHTKFGLVIEGKCSISIDNNAEPVELSAGDCYLLPRGNAFRLRDDIRTPLMPFEDALKNLNGRLLRVGGGGTLTTVIGGRFIFEGQRQPPILDLLPPLIHFKVDAAEMQALQATLVLLASETTAPGLGSPLIIDRLTEIFFVQTLRAYIGTSVDRSVGWLGAAADHHISGALRTMHEKTENAWTIESLAASVSMSRSVFASRFKLLVGEAPMEYLTRIRINKAGRMLRESEQTIGQVATRCGYESEAAFSKAFKRITGIPPGKYRTTQDATLYEHS